MAKECGKVERYTERCSERGAYWCTLTRCMAAGRGAADDGSGSGDDEREAGGVYPTKASNEGGVSEQCCRLEGGSRRTKCRRYWIMIIMFVSRLCIPFPSFPFLHISKEQNAGIPPPSGEFLFWPRNNCSFCHLGRALF